MIENKVSEPSRDRLATIYQHWHVDINTKKPPTALEYNRVVEILEHYLICMINSRSGKRQPPASVNVVRAVDTEVLAPSKGSGKARERYEHDSECPALVGDEKLTM